MSLCLKPTTSFPLKLECKCLDMALRSMTYLILPPSPVTLLFPPLWASSVPQK